MIYGNEAAEKMAGRVLASIALTKSHSFKNLFSSSLLFMPSFSQFVLRRTRYYSISCALNHLTGYLAFSGVIEIERNRVIAFSMSLFFYLALLKKVVYICLFDDS